MFLRKNCLMLFLFLTETPWMLYGIIISLSFANVIGIIYALFKICKMIKIKTRDYVERRNLRQERNPIALRQLQQNLQTQETQF